MNTGSTLPGRPSSGGLDHLPTRFGVRQPAWLRGPDRQPREPPAGPRNWASGFLPATYQGTKFSDRKDPILDIAPPPGYSEARQRGKVDFINELNQSHAVGRKDRDHIEAQIAAYELAYKMQSTPRKRSIFPPKPMKHWLCTASIGPRRKPMAAIACWPAASSNAACVSSNYTWKRQQIGRPQRPGRKSCPTLPGKRSANRRAASRSETARAARKYTGHLGRRVRPDADERKRHRTRSQPVRLHHVAGRRRRQGRHGLRRHRRDRPLRRRTSRPMSTIFTRPFCTCSVWTTNAWCSPPMAGTNGRPSMAGESFAISFNSKVPGRALPPPRGSDKRGQAPLCEASFGPSRQRCLTRMALT